MSEQAVPTPQELSADQSASKEAEAANDLTPEALSKRSYQQFSEQGVIGSPEEPETFIDSLHKIVVRSDMKGQAKQRLSREWIADALSSSDLDTEQIRSVLNRAVARRLISQDTSDEMFDRFVGSKE